MGKKRYKNIFQRYINRINAFHMDFENKKYIYGTDGVYYFNSNYGSSITEQEFTEEAYKKIDLFIKFLYNSMCSECSDLKDDNKIVLLCQTIQRVLKDNLYSNNVNVFDFFYNIFQIENQYDTDSGLFPCFSYSYDDDFLYGNNLIIQVIFKCCQGDDGNNMPVYQIRCSYAQCEGQFNEYFDEYSKSENFLTTEDYFKYYALSKENEECEDSINIAIVKLSYCNLWSDLYDKNTLKDDIKKFHDDMSNVEW